MPDSASPRSQPAVSRVERRVRGRHAPLLLALAILVLSLAATFLAWRSASESVTRERQAEFAFQTRQTVKRIEQRMLTYQQVQRGTQAFLLGSMDVRRDDFRLFVASLRLEQNFPGIQGIALVRKLAPGQVAAHAAAMRARAGSTLADLADSELAGYRVHPGGERPLYSAITHIEPFTGLNPRALGFDMLSEPIRRVAMERARDTGQAAASGKLRLIQEDGRQVQAGLVMYLPVYRRGSAPQDVAQRRADLVGWVGAPFRMEDLMAGLGGERSRDLILAIYDGGEVREEARFYASHGAPAPAQAAPLFGAVERIEIAGRQWTLEMRSAPSFEARLQSDKPRIAAALGATASVLLALLVWSLARGRRRALALATDVTQQLGESEFRWKYALEGAGDGVWDWDRSSGATVYSRRWKAMLGYAEDELAATHQQWEDLIHPDDLGATLATVARYLDSTGQPYESQFRMRCKDGSWRWIRARGMAVTRDAAGRPLRTIGTHTDTTEAKRAESTLRHANASLAAEQHRVRVILEHSHDAFIAAGSDGRISDWNAKAEALFGWSAFDAIGADLGELLAPPDTRAAFHASFRRLLDDASAGEGAPAHTVADVVEVSALHRSGAHIPVELAIASFPTAGGYAVSAFIRDLSERKEAQRLEAERSRALEEARNALEHAQKLEAVGKLTGGVAHDFNNVLHVIGGNVQLMQHMNKGDERLQQRLRSVQSAVDKGAKLSSQLLAFARRQPLQPLVLNPLRILQRMDDLLQRALGETIRIEIDAGPDAGVSLWNTLVDPGQWENVVLNLAINARDAMPQGGVLGIALHNVTLDAEQARACIDIEAGDYVRFALSDSGAGMPPDVMAMAFEPFFTTKPVGQGTGLGLSMAYGFVKQSGGHIEIDSAPARGTTITILLPRSLESEAAAPAHASGAAPGGHETVLVVEDDAPVRATTVSILRGLGYRVLEAQDGQSALDVLGAALAKGDAIDLLFTDVVMPGPVSSTALAQQARQLAPGLAVLFTSGYTRDVLTTGGRLDPSVQLLGKPYREDQLAQQVRAALGRSGG